MKKCKIWIPLCVIGGILLIGIVGILVYLNTYYHADADAEGLIGSTGEVSVTEIADGVYVDGAGTEDLLIFYPGAKVEYTAYLPLCCALAEQGMDCVIVKMPSNIAILGVDKADDVINQYDYQNYYMGGHSLGGAVAAMYTADHADQVDGLLLLAAYSTEKLDDSIPVISLYGSEDQVLQMDKMSEYRPNLPASAVELEIAGGNHAGFGNYGAQNGDGTAMITQAEEQQRVVEAVYDNWLTKTAFQ